MKAIGLQRARMRLDEAKGYLAEIRQPPNLLDVAANQHRWYLFLTALHSCREIMKTTARTSPQSRQWFGQIETNVINKDPLLSYLEKARGSDFHGMGGGAEPHVSGAEYLGYADNDVTINGKPTGTIRLSGDVDKFEFSYRLYPVRDERHPNVFEPPTSHLGIALDDASPASVAELGASYYEQLLRQAWSLAR